MGSSFRSKMKESVLKNLPQKGSNTMRSLVSGVSKIEPNSEEPKLPEPVQLHELVQRLFNQKFA